MTEDEVFILEALESPYIKDLVRLKNRTVLYVKLL